MKLSGAITRYIEMKRMLGVSFRMGAGWLCAFSRQIGDVSIASVTRRQVLSFLDGQRTANVTWLVKYRVLKAFFEYWMMRNEVFELPMPRPRVVTSTRLFAPCIYSVFELRELIGCISLRRRAAYREIEPGTLHTVLLFLYGTGARPNEALAMTQADVDLKRGTAALHRPNTDTMRTVPIGPSLLHSLRIYFKSTFRRRCEAQNFFVRKDGRPITPQTLSRAFHRLCRKAGISRRDGISRQPRMIDLRHTFAVHCLNAWLKEGSDLRSMLPILGAYLGHISLSSSEMYLRVTPDRFWTQLSRLSPRPNGLMDAQSLRGPS